MAKNLGMKGSSPEVVELDLATLEAVLVSYCCVTNYQECSDSKEHESMVSQFV